MTMQDVTDPPTFKPHDGPITHRSQDRNLTLHYTLYSQGCSSRVASYVIHEPPSREIINSGIRHNTYSHCSEPFSPPVSGIEQFHVCSKLLMIPPYFALDIFLSFNSIVTFRHLPRWYRPDSQPCRGPLFWNTPTYFVVSTLEFPKKMMTSSWLPEAAKWRHQCNGSTSSRRATKTEKIH